MSSALSSVCVLVSIPMPRAQVASRCRMSISLAQLLPIDGDWRCFGCVDLLVFL
jgi:hypothetical protein